jgi:hypothetical protein
MEPALLFKVIWIYPAVYPEVLSAFTVLFAILAAAIIGESRLKER